MGNAVMYLVALVVGTVVSAVLLGLLKKKKTRKIINYNGCAGRTK